MLMGDAVGGSPFAETAEPRNTTPTQGLIRRLTDKMKCKESVRWPKRDEDTITSEHRVYTG